MTFGQTTCCKPRCEQRSHHIASTANSFETCKSTFRSKILRVQLLFEPSTSVHCAVPSAGNCITATLAITSDTVQCTTLLLYTAPRCCCAMHYSTRFLYTLLLCIAVHCVILQDCAAVQYKAIECCCEMLVQYVRVSFPIEPYTGPPHPLQPTATAHSYSLQLQPTATTHSYNPQLQLQPTATLHVTEVAFHTTAPVPRTRHTIMGPVGEGCMPHRATVLHTGMEGGATQCYTLCSAAVLQCYSAAVLHAGMTLSRPALYSGKHCLSSHCTV
jgi:hypothetical protein